MELFSLSGEGCPEKAPGGTEVQVYYTCTCELLSMPQTKAEITPAGATPEHHKEYGEAFEFTPAGHWRTAKLVIEENELQNLFEGSKQGVAAAQVLNTKIPGFGPKTSALAQAFRDKSGCLMFAIPMKDGLLGIVGSITAPVYVDTGSTGTTGRVIGDVPGYVMNFRADTGFTTVFYDPSVLAMKTTPTP